MYVVLLESLSMHPLVASALLYMVTVASNMDIKKVNKLQRKKFLFIADTAGSSPLKQLTCTYVHGSYTH